MSGSDDPIRVLYVDARIRAARSRLRQLLENLFRNAVEHAGGDVTVTVGELEDGFYVADVGHGIPREAAFEAGYSTATDGTGFGLSIVQGVADAHGWDVPRPVATTARAIRNHRRRVRVIHAA